MENRKASPAPEPVEELVLDFDDGLHSSERQARDTAPPPFDMEAFARDTDAPNSAARPVTDVQVTIPPPPAISLHPEHSQVSQVRRAPGAVELAEASHEALEDMRAYLADRDYSGALVIAESLLEEDRTNLEAKECVLRCQIALQDVYLRRLGSLNQVPTLAVSQAELRTAALDNRSGFVVSLVDGVSSLEMILDVTGMPPLDSLRVVLELVQHGIITLD